MAISRFLLFTEPPTPPPPSPDSFMVAKQKERNKFEAHCSRQRIVFIATPAAPPGLLSYFLSHNRNMGPLLQDVVVVIDDDAAIPFNSDTFIHL